MVAAKKQGAAYEFIHPTPIVGMNYYRIQQVEESGATAYTSIMPVEIEGKTAFEVNLFPNPVATVLNIYINSTDAEELTTVN